MFFLGLICGIVLIGVSGLILMSKMGRLFFSGDISHLNFNETVAKIREKVESNPYGWFVGQEKNFNQTYLDKKKGELPFRLTEFKLGNPNHSFRVNMIFPAVTTFMPAAIAVVGYDDGRDDNGRGKDDRRPIFPLIPNLGENDDQHTDTDKAVQEDFKSE